MIQEKLKKEIEPALKAELGFKNVMQIPRLKKIVLNSTSKDIVSNSKVLDIISREMAMIAGQKPSLRKAKTSIANFKLREGVPIGCMVTLRGQRMYEFFNRLVNLAVPRARDFRGIPKRGFDGRGNFTMGVKDQVIFPEIVPDKVEKTWGMNITFVTSAETDAQGELLLRKMGLPLKK